MHRLDPQGQPLSCGGLIVVWGDDFVENGSHRLLRVRKTPLN